MNLQKVGRAQLQKMINMAGSGAVLATFKMYDDVVYNPDTGVAAEPSTSMTFKVFADKGIADETKTASIVKTDFVLTFPEGKLPRLPLTQDEVVIAGLLYKVTAVDTDPMGVGLKVAVALS